MQILKEILILILLGLLPFGSTAQVKSVGTPFINNFTRSTYQAGTQTWDIEQGRNGMMYFANNDGLLEFDGHYWNVYALPNNSIVRSIVYINDSTIYAGGYNEFGYFKIGKAGGVKFVSLSQLLPDENRNFGDVWKIFIHADGVIFQTYTQLMFYNDGMITVIPAPSAFHFSFLVKNEYYVNDTKEGLLRYAMGKLYPLIGTEDLTGKEIWGILPLGDKLLIATASEGNFIYDGNSLKPWSNDSNDFLIQNQIYSCLRLNEGSLAFGTIQNGLLICDNEGIPIQHINMDDGLQNNTVLCLGLDNFNNLWIGTDHGIDYAEINSPLTQLSYSYGLGAGYTAKIFKDYLYLGTNQGLFALSTENIRDRKIDSKKIDLVSETQGQVWSLTEIEGHLFCGHNSGTFLINGKSAQKISEIPGGWSFMQTPDNPSKIIGGNYSGVALYEKKNNKWAFSKQLKGFAESSRTIAFDKENTLWVAHGYKGLFRLFFDAGYDSILKVDFYNSENSMLSSSVVSLAKIDDEITFVTLRDVFNYSSDLNIFIQDSILNAYLKGNNIRSIKQDNIGNIWYFSDINSGVLRIQEDGSYSNITLPFQPINDKFVKGFEFVYPLDEQNVFFGAENGFIHYNPLFTKNYNYQFKTFVRSMRSFNPDSVFLFNENVPEPITLDYSNNDVEFVFSSNDFENQDQLVFSTYLQGYDEKWSDWQLRTSRDYTNLNEGKYIFRVRAKNIYGVVSDEVGISFKVYPPFHRSFLAFVIYGLALVFLFIVLVLAVKRRFEHLKARSQLKQEESFKKKEELLKRETLEAEKEVIRIRNDKLRADIRQKDKELANSTMQTLQKNKTLINLRDELKRLGGDTNDEGLKHKVKHLVKRINKEIDDEDQWKIFEKHFESVHEELLTRLKTTYPDLTPSELKLCAYLRMNISSKEISVLMNISTRGVEISRYRLRKKLNLTRDVNLTEFILSF